MDFSFACKKLCAKMKLRRPHLHCATCLTRRYHYNKLTRENYVKVSPGQKFMVAVAPLIVPKNYDLRYILIDYNGSLWKQIVKKRIIGYFLSIVEFIANW